MLLYKLLILGSLAPSHPGFGILRFRSNIWHLIQAFWSIPFHDFEVRFVTRNNSLFHILIVSPSYINSAYYFVSLVLIIFSTWYVSLLVDPRFHGNLSPGRITIDFDLYVILQLPRLRFICLKKNYYWV